MVTMQLFPILFLYYVVTSTTDSIHTDKQYNNRIDLDLELDQYQEEKEEEKEEKEKEEKEE